VKIHKRNKSSRTLRGGRRGKGWGFHKKHRGKGSKGGVGMAGTGKKGGAKITLRTRYFPNYFGKYGFVNLNKKTKLKTVNLEEINDRLNSLIKKGIIKKGKDGFEVKLDGYKILGYGECKEKLIIQCGSCSKAAKEKIEKNGGRIILHITEKAKVEENKKEK
jgi:large subunit ribosomal protein L15